MPSSTGASIAGWGSARSSMRPSRAALQTRTGERPQQPPARPRRGVLDRRAVRARTPQSRRRARDRAAPRPRSVVGRLPSAGVRAHAAAGLRSLVLADTAASFPDFVAEANRLRAGPATRRRGDAAAPRGGRDDRRPRVRGRVPGLLRPPRVPAGPVAGRGASRLRLDRADPTVYHTMNGPSEFHVIGSIKDWQSKDRLGEIRVPTLSFRPLRRGDAGTAGDAARRPRPTRSGCCSRTPRTCRTSRSASATCRSSATGWRAATAQMRGSDQAEATA